jgi:hypothetical protein
VANLAIISEALTDIGPYLGVADGLSPVAGKFGLVGEQFSKGVVHAVMGFDPSREKVVGCSYVERLSGAPKSGLKTSIDGQEELI